MPWLNYHHLYYFWMVAREGGVSKAAARLRLSQPTISAQVKMLEDALGERLLERKGRTLVLTEVGRVVDGYADEIFTAGRELLETLKGQPSGRAPQLTVGVANAVPKLVVRRLLRPATEGTPRVHVTCREGHPDQLIAHLAAHAFDVVISDAPAAPHVRVRVFSHLLEESGTTFFAGAAVAQRAAAAISPVVAQGARSCCRRSIRRCAGRSNSGSRSEDLHPLVAGEFEDSALLNAFGEAGRAVFPAPTAIEREICRNYRVAIVGRTSAVRERYYAITAERRLKHPGVVAITSAARTEVFAD